MCQKYFISGNIMLFCATTDKLIFITPPHQKVPDLFHPSLIYFTPLPSGNNDGPLKCSENLTEDLQFGFNRNDDLIIILKWLKLLCSQCKILYLYKIKKLMNNNIDFFEIDFFDYVGILKISNL